MSNTTCQWLNLDLKEALIMPKYNEEKQFGLCVATQKEREQNLQIQKILNETNQNEPQ